MRAYRATAGQYDSENVIGYFTTAKVAWKRAREAAKTIRAEHRKRWGKSHCGGNDKECINCRAGVEPIDIVTDL